MGEVVPLRLPLDPSVAPFAQDLQDWVDCSKDSEGHHSPCGFTVNSGTSSPVTLSSISAMETTPWRSNGEVISPPRKRKMILDQDIIDVDRLDDDAFTRQEASPKPSKNSNSPRKTTKGTSKQSGAHKGKAAVTAAGANFPDVQSHGANSSSGRKHNVITWTVEEDRIILNDLLDGYKPDWRQLAKAINELNKSGGRAERNFKTVQKHWIQTLKKRLMSAL